MTHKASNKTEFPTGPDDQIPLAELLCLCTDRSSIRWNYGWNLFFKKYKQWIYKAVINRCRSWKTERILLQNEEIYNDIVSVIMVKLVDEDFELLKKFNSVDNEQQFKAYLFSISDKITKNILKSHFYQKMTSLNTENQTLFNCEITPAAKWELYEMLVCSFRAAASDRKKNSERDIHLFLLYTFGDLNTEMLTSLPYYDTLGSRTLEIAVSRMRQIIQKK